MLGYVPGKPSAPISLLLISYSYPPVLGGSEIEAQRVCAGLKHRGYQVKVLCAGIAPMPLEGDWLDPNGVPVRTFGRRHQGKLREQLFAMGVAWTLWKERRNYQLVYFLMQGLHLAAGLPLARWLRKPVVMKISGSSIITLMLRSRLGRIELEWLKKWASRVMILNSGMAEEAHAAGFRQEQLLWMPNPVDTVEFAPANLPHRRRLRAAFGVSDDTRLVLYVGRLAPEKELPSLLGAFAQLLPRIPDALLVLVGDGPGREQLVALATELGIAARVRFTGRQATPEVLQWLQAADVFALLSSNEGFPCSLLEAMAAGLPSVVSDIPANVQLIQQGVQGVCVPVGDQAAIASALEQVLCNPEQAARMGQAARECVLKQYSLGQVLDRYETMFREALDRGR